MAPSLLSNSISTEARPAGLRVLEPLKITSSIVSLRSWRIDCSPSSQRIASMMLDLPQPLGPTIDVRFDGRGRWLKSTKDLNPASLMAERRILFFLCGRHAALEYR